MAVTPLPHPTSRDLVANARGLMEALTSTDWSALEDVELVTVVEAIQALHAVTRAAELMAVAEIDDRDVAREQLGWGSTADWYTHLAGVRRGQGRRTVDHAAQLTHERPATLEALASGAVSPEHVDVVLDAVDRLPATASLRDDVESALLDRASRLTATDLQRAVRHVIDVADPDHHQRDLEKQLDREDRVAHHRRMLSISEDGSGGVRIKGRGTLEDGAVLRAALLPLTAPMPTVDPETCEQMPDPRDFGVRMWDALVGVAQHSLDTNQAPEAHGAQPRVAVDDGSRHAAGQARRAWAH